MGVWPTPWWGCSTQGAQGRYAWHLQVVPAITWQITSLTWLFDSMSLVHGGASESYWGPSFLWMVYRVFLTKGAIVFNSSSWEKLEWRDGAPLQDLRLFMLSQLISS